jgi:hypothetical protein
VVGSSVAPGRRQAFPRKVPQTPMAISLNLVGGVEFTFFPTLFKI